MVMSATRLLALQVDVDKPIDSDLNARCSCYVLICLFPLHELHMASITTFFRKTPLESLKAYLATKSFTLPLEVDWAAKESEVITSLIEAVGNLTDDDRETLIREVERIIALADEAGQNALDNVIANRECFDTIEGGHNRALWALMNEREGFERAAEVRYNDEKRLGRMWSAFIVETRRRVCKDQSCLDALTAGLQLTFKTPNVHVDIFDRHRVTFDDKRHELVQITVYRQGRRKDELDFDDAGKLEWYSRKPVHEASLTYEPSKGVIEVVARDRQIREAMVGLIARHLLNIEFAGQKLPAREYDLSVLMKPYDFPTDASAPAGQAIERVDVKELRLQPIDNVDQRITLECSGSGDLTIWDMADRYVGKPESREAGWVITRARLVIRFARHGKSSRSKTLNLMITIPHGCNLKSLTVGERLVGEKYLREWGILKGGPVTDAAHRT